MRHGLQAVLDSALVMLSSLILTLAAAAIPAASPSSAPLLAPNAARQASPRRWAAFQIDTLKKKRAATGRNYLEFIARGDLKAGLYHLPAGSEDDQQPHRLDEIYYVLNGAGALEVGGTSHSVKAGETCYVKAEVPHRFRDISEDLDVIVIFSRTPPAKDGPDGLRFSRGEMLAGRTADKNVWNPFLKRPTIILGMYMLPEAVGGDRDLTHAVDEISIVVNGRGILVADGMETSVRPGSIVFVERGAPHHYRSLVGDLDTLILWNQ